MGKKVHDCTCGAFDDSCLAKVEVGEPIFVLRAQDITAPEVVAHWVTGAGNRLAPAKRAEALKLSGAMRAWSYRKLPD